VAGHLASYRDDDKAMMRKGDWLVNKEYWGHPVVMNLHLFWDWKLYIRKSWTAENPFRR